MSRDYTYCLECGSESNVAARKCEKCRLKAEVERQIDDRHKLQKELNAMENEHFNETNKLKRALEREREANAKLQKKCGTCDDQGIIFPVVGFDPIGGEKFGEPEPCPECDEMARLREANAKLREALEAIASDRWIMGECQIDDFKGMDEKSIAKQALLNMSPESQNIDTSQERVADDAKQDEGNG